MITHIKRGGMAVMALLTALLLSLTLASAASAHTGTSVHDDQNGVASTDGSHSPTHPGSGSVDAVDNDSPADAVNVIRDYGLENAPIIIGVIGAIFLVGLTFYLVRRGLMKARGAMRL